MRKTDKGEERRVRIKYEDEVAWVAANQILPDEPVVRTAFPKEVILYIDGKEEKRKLPLRNWFIPGGGAYIGKPQQVMKE